MAFDEKTGAFLWQAVHDKVAAGRVNDWPFQGIASSPLIEGDRVYYVSNRAELMCVDLKGFADKENDGPVTDEKAQGEGQADVVWRLDMMEEVGTFPHNLANSSPVVLRRPRLSSRPRTGRTRATSTSLRRRRRPSSPSTRRRARSSGRTPRPATRFCTGSGQRPRSGKIGGVDMVVIGAGRRLGARLRGRDGQEALGVRHQPEGLDVAQDAQRDHLDARHLRGQGLPRQRAGPRARRGRRPHVLHRRHQARRHHEDRPASGTTTRFAAPSRRRPSPTASSTSPTSAASSTRSTRRRARRSGCTTCSRPCGARRC